MAKLEWNKSGERFYETGVDRGVLYVPNQNGVAWNGLISVTESPSGGESTPYYADNSQYVSHAGLEKFGGTIEAFTYPEEFEACDGSLSLEGLTVGQQGRRPFGFSYRTILGNDVSGLKHSYKIHLVYNAMAVPTDTEHATINDTPEASTFSWDFTTTPVKPFTATLGNTRHELKPFSHVVINSNKTSPDLMIRIEEYLYGNNSRVPKLFSLADLINLYNNPLASMIINPRPSTGLSTIADSYTTEGDVTGSRLVGLYSEASKTRLTETTEPGLFTLE